MLKFQRNTNSTYTYNKQIPIIKNKSSISQESKNYLLQREASQKNLAVATLLDFEKRTIFLMPETEKNKKKRMTETKVSFLFPAGSQPQLLNQGCFAVEVVKVYDGNNSLRRRIFRTIVVSRTASLDQVLTQSLRAFHITKDAGAFYVTDLYAPEETELQDSYPIMNLHRKEGKRPAIFLRFR